jgi:uncharacterized membrane protein
VYRLAFVGNFIQAVEAGSKMANEDSLFAKSPENATAWAKIVYVAYLLGFVLGGVSSVFGVVVAYVYRDEAPGWVKTHFQFQIRTFWIGLLFCVAGFFTILAFVGWFILLAGVVWFIIRCFMGLKVILAREPYPNPTAWTW